MNLDKFAILFTICFVGYMNIVIILLSDNYAHESDIPVLIISGLVLFVFAYAFNKKNPRIKQKISPRNYLFFLILGAIVGVLIISGINSTKDFDSQNAPFTDFLVKLFVSIGSKAGLLFFSIMAMSVSILYVPYIKDHIIGYDKTRWIPFVGGVTVGFGIMAIIDFALHGLGII